MNTIYQLWGIPSPQTDWDGLLRKVDLLQDRHPADALVCGIQAPKDAYTRIIRRARQDGTQVYLWLPVFSELDELAVFDPLVDWRGNAFLSNRELDGFRFRCPGSSRNREIFFHDSLDWLQAGDFDGVFLDRIRFPSFQFGLSGILGCFCPHCLKKYERMGLAPVSLRAACERICRSIEAKEANPLGLLSFDGHRWIFRDPDIQAMFDARCTVLEETMTALCAAYRERGYKIGLDLFTPALAYFAGQDFDRLVPLSDFSKPMMYLNTDAPAGLPYELDAVAEHTGEQSRKMMMSLSGGNTIDDFASAEIRRLTARYNSLYPSVRIYCGMEYNRVADLAPVGPCEIAHTLYVFRGAGANGVMPSWSLISAPDDNIESLLTTLGEMDRPGGTA